MLTRLPHRIDTRLRSGLVAVRALTEAADWIEHRRTDVLVLEGDTGCGKSVAAAWCFAFASYRAQYSGMGTRATPVWCDASIVADSLAEWSPEWSKFDDASLIVLDDVGTERKPDRMTTILERLFNVAGGRAVITTNLSPESFADRYGARVRSRVIGEGSWVACAEQDMRMETPSGPAFREPDEPTASEVATRRRLREEQERINRDALPASRIDELTADLMARLGAETLAGRRESDAKTNARRQELRKQVETLTEDDDEEQVH